MSSSPNYHHLAHLKLPLKDILSATNNFAEENLMEEANIGNGYMGELVRSDELINIYARRWSNKEWDGEKEQQFWMEISLLSSLDHKNVASLIGFCDENDEKIIVIKHEVKGGLGNYLDNPMLLTWTRRLEICVGLANAISYIYYDEQRDFSLIHRNIDSATVVLSDNWEPKLSEFRLSMKIDASQKHLSFDTDNVSNTIGYTDPTYLETKSAHHKSDIYSFGIVMFELLCGRNAVIDGDQDNKYLASVAVAHNREKKLHEIIDWDLWDQMDSQSFNVFAEIAYDCLNEDRSERPDIDEIVTRLEKALELQLHHNAAMSSLKDDLAHLKIPLESILSATNKFSKENLRYTRRFANEYKGQLLWSGKSINIIARRVDQESKKGKQAFWMEISLLSSLEHKNLVSLVGFCDENDEKIIIIRSETRGSLGKYLSDSMRLTWVRRLEISVGLAHALRYIHYDESRDFSIIHRNIKTSVVELNDEWEPKLSCFEFSMKMKASQRHYSFGTKTLLYTDGYGDPTYIETKSVGHKSDMYSFGIVLLELLCGRYSIIDDEYNKYLAPVAITHYKEKKLHEIVDCDLWKQMDSQSFNMFAEIAYECLDEERSRRPNIDDIVPRLEKALELARQNRPIRSAPDHLAHLRIPLEDIESATNYFDYENLIEGGAYGKRYKGQLSWSGELINITIHRLINKEWDEPLFWKTISMLSSLEHKHLVSVVGLCYEVGAEIIVYTGTYMGRLDEFLSDPLSLRWVKRLKIAIGLAQALSYIHYDEPRDFSVIHRNINSYAILLKDDWEPMLWAFHHSIKIKASERNLTFHTDDNVWSNKGYADPTYLETSNTSHKADIYSLGIVLFELLCGRKSVSSDQDNKYLAPGAIFHYREKILDGIIDPGLWKQMNSRSLNIFAETAYECLNEEQSNRPNMDQIVTRLEKALELQLECENAVHSSLVDEVGGTSFSHEEGSASHTISIGVEHQSSRRTSFFKYLSDSELSFKDIQSATDNFALKNTLKENKFGFICQGRMLHSGQFIDIVARATYLAYQKDERKKFRMEKSMLSSLNHTNLVSIIGFCEKNNRMITVYKKEANGSLNKHLNDETLTCMQRLKICLGVANALSYIQYDVQRDFSVIHCNIKSSKILLDDKWEPKLSGFKLALKNTVARRHHLLLTRDMIENVYLDPKYKKSGGMTHKSDVYSFGVVLFEVLCGMSAIHEDDEDKNKEKDKDKDEEEGEEEDDHELGEGLLTQLAKSHFDEMVMPHLRKQMDPGSFKIFSETAYWCIKDDRADRPYIDQVVKRLEKALELQWKHENPINRTPSVQLKGNLEHLKIGLDLIKKATKNFDDEYCIGSGGFGKVFKADLEHFDSSTSSSINGADIRDLPKKRSTVAIKRINNQEGEQGFIAEIETLTSCKHENIISLLGFCYEGNGAMILVYEHASKGSLENYLGSSDKMTNLTWVQRLNICLDIANGLNYIHNNTDHGKQKMIHRDIKSDNILLGDNWKAKIADFGLSKFHPADQVASTIHTNIIAGTYMYLDPEYQSKGKLNKKSDIYSFGVVLLEILTGRLAYDSVYTKVK